MVVCSTPVTASQCHGAHTSLVPYTKELARHINANGRDFEPVWANIKVRVIAAMAVVVNRARDEFGGWEQVGVSSVPGCGGCGGCDTRSWGDDNLTYPAPHLLTLPCHRGVINSRLVTLTQQCTYS